MANYKTSTRHTQNKLPNKSKTQQSKKKPNLYLIQHVYVSTIIRLITNYLTALKWL